jgi:hypothetical protein
VIQMEGLSVHIVAIDEIVEMPDALPLAANSEAA